MIVLKIAAVLGLFALAMYLGLAAHAGPARDKPNKSCTPESLVGRYVIVSGEKEGVKEPEDRVKGTTVAFTKDSVTVVDKVKKELYSASYKLDSTRHPCDITMTSRVESTAGEIARGLIEKDGETVRLIYALPMGEIPTEFKTKVKQLMFVMKKTE
jgi:uncharacterized protein (TIGR03067 family)